MNLKSRKFKVGRFKNTMQACEVSSFRLLQKHPIFGGKITVNLR